MTYSHNSSDPMVLLAATANTLINQYESKSISLQEYKDAANAQLVTQFQTLDVSSHNDNAYNTLTRALVLIDSVE